MRLSLLHILSIVISTSIPGILSNDKPQDANIFTDLWSTLTQSGKVAACPGECVHAITSIFCDHVLEEVSCGESYLRCCVPNDFSYGTPVETSPPISHDIDKLYAVTDTLPPLNAAPSTRRPSLEETPDSSTSSPSSSTTSDAPSSSSTSLLPLLAQLFTTEGPDSSGPSSSASPSSTTSMETTGGLAATQPQCPGVCVKSEYARFCGNIMSNGRCGSSDEACCLQSETDSVNMTSPLYLKKPTLPLSAIVSYPEASEVTTTVEPTSKEPSTTTTEAPGQSCEGTCVAPLFSLLCDEVDHDQFCPNGGTCCINKEPTTTPPPISPCPGSCIPTFLSGVCNRPSELILKTSDCFPGTICCKNADPGQPLAGNVEQENKHEFSETNAAPILTQPPAKIRPPIALHQNPLPLLTPGYGPSGYPSPPRPGLPYFGSFYQGGPSWQQRPQIFPNMGPPLPVVQMMPTLQHPPPSHPSLGAESVPPLHLINQPSGGGPLAPPSRVPQSVLDMVEPSEAPLSPPEAPKLEPTFAAASQFCPGSCISMLLKFTCLGDSALFPKFQCSQPGQICCAPTTGVESLDPPLLSSSLVPPPLLTNTIPNKDPTSATVLPLAVHPPDRAPAIAVATTPVPTTSTASIMTSTTPAPAHPPPTLLPFSPQPIKPAPPRKPHAYSCGIKGTQRRESPRIVGGSDAVPGEWCWQIALINAQNQYLCGGALIGTQWVATAAHCITNLVRNGEEIFIRVGDFDLTNTIASSGAQTKKVSTTYIHHNHNSQTLDNDIALLKMESHVELNESVCLVCLPARGSNRKPGKKCTVTGYGYTSESGPIALKVREAQVPVVDDQQCTVKINAVTEKLFILPASSFCAGGTHGNDACQGDGGGPLVCEQEGFYELTGLVSWGFGCGRPDVPAVYVKVSSFIGWINQIISVNNNN